MDVNSIEPILKQYEDYFESFAYTTHSIKYVTGQNCYYFGELYPANKYTLYLRGVTPGDLYDSVIDVEIYNQTTALGLT